MVSISQLRMRTARYEFVDGIRDFQMAFWILVTGFYALIVWDSPDVWLPYVAWIRSGGTLFVLLMTFGVPIAVPLLISELALRAANEYVRRRWLWRETGFIKSKFQIFPRYILIPALVIAMVTFVAGILLAIQREDATLILRGLYVGIGFEFAFTYLVVGVRLQIPRHQVLGVVGLIGTLLLAALPLRIGLFAFLLSVFWAALLIISGFYGMKQIANQQKARDDAG